MTPAERDELNAAVARLDGWRFQDSRFDYGPSRWIPPDCPPQANFLSMPTDPPDYLGDPRLWAPILERLCRAGWILDWTGKYFLLFSNTEDAPCAEGDTLAEAVLRLFVALRGEV